MADVRSIFHITGLLDIEEQSCTATILARSDELRTLVSSVRRDWDEGKRYLVKSGVRTVQYSDDISGDREF